MQLRDLVEAEGWTYVEDPHPGERQDALGAPQTEALCWAQACAENVMAVKPGVQADAIHAVSHEMAEVRSRFMGHGEPLLNEQILILTHWCRDLLQESRAKSAANADAPPAVGSFVTWGVVLWGVATYCLVVLLLLWAFPDTPWKAVGWPLVVVFIGALLLLEIGLMFWHALVPRGRRLVASLRPPPPP